MHLRKGSTHELVSEVQEKLLEKDYESVSVSGVYDEDTQEAVISFQKEKGLDPKGTVDKGTLDALDIDKNLPEPEFERAEFRSLLAGNPNYFGNLVEVPFEPVEEFMNETSYEELVCVGYNPPLNRLDAVIHIKREYGYSGDICADGSTEYVRFYVDWENDGTWEDVGISSTEVHDIPGEKPLEYAVSHPLDPDEKLCSIEQLPKIRAILSWNQPPPAGDPDHQPVWGNIIDARIQIKASDEPLLGDLIDEFEINPDLLTAIKLDQPISVTPPSPSLPDLLKKYEQKGVPGHRTAFTQIQSHIDTPTFIDTPLMSEEPELEFEFPPLFDLDIDIDGLLDDFLDTDTNTSYEELNCLGLEDNRLTGVLTIKRPSGYLGGLCTEGSTEYVAFWEWREDKSAWDYLGTTAVDVHDIDAMPSQGLQYSVSLPVDLSHRRQPCSEGASTARIRAVASWQTPPSTTDPFWTPAWGNRMESRIHISPGPSVEEGEQIATVHYVGNMNVCNIDQSTGLATGSGKGVSGDKSPFGGKVYVSGFLSNPPRVMDGEDPIQYRVSVRPHEPSLSPSENPWQPVTDPFTARATELPPSSPPTTNIPIRQTPDDDGFFDYLVDLSSDTKRWVDEPTDNILAVWDTGGKNGRWEIKVESKVADGTIVPGGPILCSGGGERRIIKVELDNVGPEADIEITGFERDGGPVETAGECETFFIGDVIHGTYTGTDVNFDDVGYFGHLRLRVRPDEPANGARVDPRRRRHTEAAVPETGIESGTWQLETEWVDDSETKQMEPCGYIIENDVWDRTIVNSTGRGRHDEEEVGFCLEERPEQPDGGTVMQVVTETPAITEGVETKVDDGTPEEVSLAMPDHQFDSLGDDHDNLNEEHVTIENTGEIDVSLTGWRIEDDAGHTYAFPDGFRLDAGEVVTVRTGIGDDTETDLYWGSKHAIWDNTGDSVSLYDDDGNLVLKKSY